MRALLLPVAFVLEWTAIALVMGMVACTLACMWIRKS